jgi:Ca-activated chloride channel homolog
MKKFAAILFGLLLIVSGCSAEEDKNEAEKEGSASVQSSSEENTESADATKEDKNTEEGSMETFFSNLPKVPTNTVELVNQTPGIFADQEVLSDETEPKFLETIKDLPPLDESASEEEYDQYFQYIYSLFATDFADPDDLISKWEFSMFGDPKMEDSRYQFKENINIEIILDSSGSMANIAEGGKTQMKLAKEAINEFLSKAPKEANVSLRVYGHVGTGSDADKEKSCSRIENVYELKTYDQKEFQKALNQFEPSGWTPIAGALESSKDTFKSLDAKTNTNFIYLVSDGIETCGGNPVKVAKSFAESNVSPIINVIGFNVDGEAQQQLQQVADSANGIYTTVSNKEQLETEFSRAQEILTKWEDWKDNALRNADSQRLDNKFEILGFKNDWSFISTRQKLNLNFSFDILREEGKITFDQRDELRKRSADLEELSDKALDEIIQDLHEVNLEKLEDLKQQINEKYNTNTQT